MTIKEFRGSNGQTLNTMAVALEQALQQSKSVSPAPASAKSVQYTNPKRVAAAAAAATTPTPAVDPDLPDVSDDSVLWFRHDAGYNFVPRTGFDGKITPTIGWLIDILGLQYIERKTAGGTHLVILRNEHLLRQDTETNTLYHFYFPADSDTALAVNDTAGGSVDDIVADIETRQDNFELVPVMDEMERAFAVSRRMSLVAYEMGTTHPLLRKRMDFWHKADYAPGMNYF